MQRWVIGVCAVSALVLSSCVTKIFGPDCQSFVPSPDETTPVKTVRRGEDMLFRQAPHAQAEELAATLAETWPGGRIPYQMAATFREGWAADGAVRRWNSIAAETGVQFVPHGAEANYVEFVSESAGCFAAVGLHGGRQVVNLDGSCGDLAALHELGHSIGLIHEHQRPDRDQYIEVLWQNLDSTRATGWEVMSQITALTTYDVQSLMHYRPWDGSINGQPVMLVRNANIPLDQVGARDIMASDIAGVRALYKDGASAFADDQGCVY